MEDREEYYEKLKKKILFKSMVIIIEIIVCIVLTFIIMEKNQELSECTDEKEYDIRSDAYNTLMESYIGEKRLPTDTKALIQEVINKNNEYIGQNERFVAIDYSEIEKKENKIMITGEYKNVRNGVIGEKNAKNNNSEYLKDTSGAMKELISKISNKYKYTLTATYGKDGYINLIKINIYGRNVDNMRMKKPIIYLYPEEETDVSVVAKYPEKFTHTYPKYVDGWNVLAKPDGTLYDKKTGRELYALYWEGIDDHESDMTEGFCVKGEDTIEFLEKKLALLGLNEREAEEFIVYWLPKLEENKYNYIHFLTTEKVEELMPLEITPEPDTRIRILMEYKGLDKEINVKEQKIETPERNGFVMVEWGGTEIK